MIVIPERRLKQVIDYCLEYVRQDYLDMTDKNNSYLAYIFRNVDVTLQTKEFDYFKEATALFTRDEDHPRHIETHYFLNRERFSIPTIHIQLTANNVAPANGVGFDRDWDNPFNRDKTQSDSGFYDDIITGGRSFQTVFQVVFTSDNLFEVQMMYYLITACLVGNVWILEENDIHNPSLSANDLILDSDIAPSNIYARALQITCFFDMVAPEFDKKRIVGGLVVNGVLLQDDCPDTD